MAVTNIPNVQNWTVTPQNGQSGYFDLMNTWLGQSTLVIASLQSAITAQNLANAEINTLASQVTLDTSTTVTAKNEAVSALALLSSGSINDTTIGTDKAYSNRKVNELLSDYVDDLVLLATDDFIGVPFPFPTTVVPTGFIEYNGATISRTAYAKLFARLGTTYGAGDGSTTFQLPDLRGEFIRGWDNTRGIDSGRTIGSWQVDELKSHSHTGITNTTGAHTHTYSGMYDARGPINGASGLVFQNTQTTSSSGAHSHTVTIDSTGGIETRPRNIAMMYCAKY